VRLDSRLKKKTKQISKKSKYSDTYLLPSRKFSGPRIMLIILKCLKAKLIYSNAKVTSSPAIWASVSDGDAIKQSHGKGS
jgi:hypothetical protein